MPTGPVIKTTTVGSYPIPNWLVSAPSEQALIDATRVVIATQEHAGIDLVCDGELYRFDINHPETNGMIEYFVKPMDGVRTEIGFEELLQYRAQPGMAFRTRPTAVVDAALSGGTLNLPDACARARTVATRPLKFTVTGPHMLAKTVLNKHYKDTPALCMAIADVLAQQVRHIDAEVVQLDEANLPGHPEEWEWAAAAINRVLDARRPWKSRGPSLLRQLRRTIRSKRKLGQADCLSQQPACRSYRDGERASPGRRTRRVPGLAARDRHGSRRHRRQANRDRTRGRGGAFHRAGGTGHGSRTHQIRASRLRILDAQPNHCRWQDSRPGSGARSV